MFGAIILCAIAGAVYGAVLFLAGAMSDAPNAGDDAAKTGAIIVIVSICVVVLAIIADHKHWLS